jgi:hypothetical protein
MSLKRKGCGMKSHKFQVLLLRNCFMWMMLFFKSECRSSKNQKLYYCIKDHKCFFFFLRFSNPVYTGAKCLFHVWACFLLNNFFNIKILIYFKIKNIFKKYKTPSYPVKTEPLVDSRTKRIKPKSDMAGSKL